MSNEAIQAQLEANRVASARVQIGEPITNATASQPVYADSGSNFAAGAIPFSLPLTGAASTTQTFWDITGTSTLSGSNDLGSQFVVGSAVTTATVTGYVKVTLTDSGGNITDGDHYLPVYTLA